MNLRVYISVLVALVVIVLVVALCHSYYTRPFYRAIDYNSHPPLLLDDANRLEQDDVERLIGLLNCYPQGSTITVTASAELKCAALLLGTLEVQHAKAAIRDGLCRARELKQHGFARELLWALYRIEGDAAAPDLVDWVRWQYATKGDGDGVSEHAMSFLRSLSLRGGPLPYSMQPKDVIVEAEQMLIEIASHRRIDRWRAALDSMGYNVGYGKSVPELMEAIRFLRDVFDGRPIAGLGTAWDHDVWDRNGCVFETWRILSQRLDGNADLRFPDSPIARVRTLKADPTVWEYMIEQTKSPSRGQKQKDRNKTQTLCGQFWRSARIL